MPGCRKSAQPWPSWWSRLRAAQKELRDLQRDERELARRVDLLTFQVEEIEKAGTQPGEDEELANERSRLANSERLSSLCDAIYALLIESPKTRDEFCATQRARRAASLDARCATRWAMPPPCWPNWRGSIPRWRSTRPRSTPSTTSVEELGRTMRVYRESVEHDPGRLEEIEERISLLHELKRKYGPTPGGRNRLRRAGRRRSLTLSPTAKSA